MIKNELLFPDWTEAVPVDGPERPVTQVTFHIYARAAPQGSKKAFMAGGKARVVDTNPKRLHTFRNEATRTAMVALNWHGVAMAGKHQPVEIVIEFMEVRPRSAPKKRLWPVVKPDIDKLERALLDALTGVVFEGDAQVVRVLKEKVYGPIDRVRVSARVIKEAA